MSRIALIGLSLALLVCACDRPKNTKPSTPLAVTNTLLECAARDILGESTPILRLSEPGMCPGHFDIRPSQVNELKQCRLLLRLDFQKSLDARLADTSTTNSLLIGEITIKGGLCVPGNYISACQQTADQLVRANLIDRDQADQRLRDITKRLETKVSQYRQQLTPLKDTPVLASAHQEGFCKWLGLRPVATFSGADTALISQVDSAVRSGEAENVRIIIANLPEGRRVADALADRLDAEVVVFGNFPALNQGQTSFEDLLQSNIESLLEASRS